MTRLGILALTLILLAPAGALAQTTGSDLGRSLTRPLRRAPRERPASEPEEAEADPDQGEADEEDPSDWPGPQIQLGYGYTKLADGFGGGDTHTGGLLVFLQWPIHELRTGLLAELGGRDYSVAGDDFFARGRLEVGVQLPRLIDPLVPHVSALLSVGAIVGERFETTVSHVFAGGGIEIGAALRVFRNLHLMAAFAYERWEMDGASFDMLMIRLGLGL